MCVSSMTHYSPAREQSEINLRQFVTFISRNTVSISNAFATIFQQSSAYSPVRNYLFFILQEVLAFLSHCSLIKLRFRETKRSLDRIIIQIVKCFYMIHTLGPIVLSPASCQTEIKSLAKKTSVLNSARIKWRFFRKPSSLFVLPAFLE